MQHGLRFNLTGQGYLRSGSAFKGVAENVALGPDQTAHENRPEIVKG